MFETKEKLLEAIIKSIPYSEQIINFDLSENDCIYFNWRDSRYKAGLDGHFFETDGTFLSITSNTILMEKLIFIIDFYSQK